MKGMSKPLASEDLQRFGPAELGQIVVGEDEVGEPGCWASAWSISAAVSTRPMSASKPFLAQVPLEQERVVFVVFDEEDLEMAAI